MKSILFTLVFLVACKLACAQKVDKDNTMLADRPTIGCPIQQRVVKNGAKPDPELCKKIIRCLKDEAPAQKGYDGATTVDVTSIQIGTPRKWDILRDSGNGVEASTIIYPVKAVYTVKQFYRTTIYVSANWVRIINFYVNAFGEWATGSEEPVKIGTRSQIALK